jgi:hypothetical protein
MVDKQRMGRKPPPDDDSIYPCFNQWLGAQSGRADPIGKLSRAIQSDRCWPALAEDDYLAFRQHLRLAHSELSVDTIMAFEAAWEEFQSETTRQEPATAVVRLARQQSSG